jgi:hypothetical protein
VEGKNRSSASSNRDNWNHLKSFRKYLSNILGKHEIKELQKTDMLGTAHTLRKELMSKYTSCVMGNNITCSYHILQHRITVIRVLYTPDTRFVSGI